MATSKTKFVADAVMDFTPRPTVDSVLDAFYAQAGGAAQVGKMLYDEYVTASPGSMIRAKVFELILRRMEKSEERSRRDDFDGLTDEDLRLAIAAREQAMLKDIAAMEAVLTPALTPDPEVPT